MQNVTAQGSSRHPHEPTGPGAAAFAGYGDTASLVRWGQRAARAGYRDVAHHLFATTLELDPSDGEAWLWRAGTSDQLEEALFCLEQAYVVNPGDHRVHRGLEDVRRRLAEAKQQAAAKRSNRPFAFAFPPARSLLYAPAGLLLVTSALVLAQPQASPDSAPSAEIAVSTEAGPSTDEPSVSAGFALNLEAWHGGITSAVESVAELPLPLDRRASVSGEDQAAPALDATTPRSAAVPDPAPADLQPPADRPRVEASPTDDASAQEQPRSAAPFAALVALPTPPAAAAPGEVALDEPQAGEPDQSIQSFVPQSGGPVASILPPREPRPRAEEQKPEERRAAQPTRTPTAPPRQAEPTVERASAPTTASGSNRSESRPRSEPTRRPTQTARPTRTAEPTREPSPTATATREPTREPTATTEPTRTPRPTRTPTPDPTPEPTAEPTPTAASRLPTPAPPARPARQEGFVWPARGPLTTYFGEVGPYSPRGHAGIDIAAPMGAPILAVDDGLVVTAARDGGYGIFAVIDHGNGVRTLYAHMSQILVGGGEKVERGQLIGHIGSTGYSTGPHLHFEVTVGGARRDPLAFLP